MKVAQRHCGGGFSRDGPRGERGVGVHRGAASRSQAAPTTMFATGCCPVPPLATREQQAALFAAGGLLHAELLPVSGSILADLDRARLTDYLGRVLTDQIPQDEAAWLERLCGLGFMAERTGEVPVCTIAGLVLFAHRPRRLLRQAGLRWMAFRGDDMDYQSLDDAVLDAPLVGLWSTSGTGQVYRAQSGHCSMPWPTVIGRAAPRLKW